jgi:uncharacterized protein (DUF488 family)
VNPIFTIGHSTRPIEDFIALLKAHQIELLVDVRTVPRSRHNPQFNSDALPDSLGSENIAYRHMPELGGLRRPRKDSTNTAWRNLSFRGYADYMETSEFENGLAQLIEEAAARRSAIMCAEAVPWRCHRSLIADALVARGLEAFEISSLTRAQPHKITPFAQIKDGKVRYPDLLSPVS